MPKLQRLSGKEVIKRLGKHGFQVIRQKGSHVRLKMNTGAEAYELTVPIHKELDRGTLRSIIRSLEKCLPEKIIKELFYTK